MRRKLLVLLAIIAVLAVAAAAPVSAKNDKQKPISGKMELTLTPGFCDPTPVPYPFTWTANTSAKRKASPKRK